MKTPIVFSLINEQSRFMKILISFLTFLAVFTFGITLATTHSIIKWNNEWDLFTTVQVMQKEHENKVLNIINENKNKFNFVRDFSKQEIEKIMSPWISGNKNIASYLPKMYEIKFKNKNDIKIFKDKIIKYARFLTYSKALQNTESTGQSIIVLSLAILSFILIAISVSISYIAKNTALLHKRELEILNQIGATDSFIAEQMQIIVFKICSVSSIIGFISAIPFLTIIINSVKTTRIGIISMMELSGLSWIILILMPILIIIIATYITRKTTFNILKNT